jgi:mRNA interferase MazF
LKRGDIVTIAQPGDFGKPRPAVIIQVDRFDTTSTVIVVPLTSAIEGAPILRPDVPPTAGNGLRLPSQAMIDKISAISRAKIGRVVGQMEDEVMTAITRSVALVLGLAD